LFIGSYPFIVYFSTEKEGWVGTKDGLLYTQNGGKSWESRHVSGEGQYVSEYWFYDNQDIRAGFAYGNKYKSHDGGNTWQYDGGMNDF